VWWPTDAITGTRRSATVRQSVSSQNATEVGERAPAARDTITSSTASTAASSCTRA
jgi:hypothetical protein